MRKLMYKGLFGLGVFMGGAIVALHVHAAEETNTVRMVTYFPVHYARYNNIYVTDKLDIGTSQEEFSMEVGDSASSQSFTVNNVNLRKGDSASTLSIAQDVFTDTATFGKSGSGTTTVNFGDLYLETLTTSANVDIDVDTLKVNALSQFKFNSRTFPECNKVRWKTLNFDGTSKSYLMCCDAGNADEACKTTCQGYGEWQQSCAGSISGLEGQIKDLNGNNVAGIWTDSSGSSGSGDGSCYCNCSSASYKASVSGQWVTGADKVETSDKKYQYCQEKCWSDSQNGHVNLCVNRQVLGSDTGAQWDYANCQCNCSASNEVYVQVPHVNYLCTHVCYNDRSSDKHTDCEKSLLPHANATWKDIGSAGNCYCQCPTTTNSSGERLYQQSEDGKKCYHRCVKGNPSYAPQINGCESSGGTWKGATDCDCKCPDGKSFTDNKCQ